MNIPHLPFAFVSDVPSYDTAEVFFVHLDPDICQTDELLRALYYGLWLPGYFGFNWDALYDSLCDLAWIPQKKLVILHAKLPSLPEADSKIYLEVLRDAVQNLAVSGQHVLEVIFPESDRSEIERLLAS